MWNQENDNFNSSYFYGRDTKHGWGNTTFFSFFSQFNRSSSAYGIIESIIFCLLFVLSLYFNVVVFSQLICNRRLRSVTNSLICNLTLADMFLTIGCPLIAVTRITGSWIFGSWACSMMVYSNFVCGFVGIWTMTLISVDRYLCIVNRSGKRLTQRSAMLILCIVWGSALLCFLPMILYFDTKDVQFGQSQVTICTMVWPKHPNIRISIVFISILLICGFLIPFSLLTWSYVNIFRKFWNIRQNIIKPPKTTVTPVLINTLDFKKRRDQRDFRIVKTLFSLLIFFFVMYTPIFIVMVFIVAERKMIISSQVFIFSVAVCMGNAVINPFYYGIMVERLRTRLKSCFKCSTVDGETTHIEENGRIRAISDGVVSDPRQ